MWWSFILDLGLLIGNEAAFYLWARLLDANDDRRVLDVVRSEHNYIDSVK